MGSANSTIEEEESWSGSSDFESSYSYSDEESYNDHDPQDDETSILDENDDESIPEQQSIPPKDTKEETEASTTTTTSIPLDMDRLKSSIVENDASLDNITRDVILKHCKSSPVLDLLDHVDLKVHTPLALQILEKSDKIRGVRFSLVPGRIKEHAFWATVFYLLDNQPQQCNGDHHTTNNKGDEKEEENNDEELVIVENGGTESNTASINTDSNNGHPTGEEGEAKEFNHDDNGTTPHNHNTVSSTYGESFQQVMNGNVVSHLTESLQRQVREKTWQILSLEKQLEEANERISQLESAQQNASRDTSKQHYHKGKWVMTQDSQDFLALDDEIKENLRREKQRRLEEVKEQMKFILDSDHVSFGEWDCCHETSLDAQGCCVKGKEGD